MVTLVKNILLVCRKKIRIVFFVLALFIFLLHYFLNETKSSTRLRNESFAPVQRYFDTLQINKNRTDTFLLVAIMTGPKNFDRRIVFRETWLASPNDKAIIKHVFIIGTKNLDGSVISHLKHEQQLFKDLVLLEEFEDAYEKLTEKLGLSFLYLTQKFNFKYLFKVDDDTYALLDNIVDDLQHNSSLSSVKNLYWGYFYGRGHVKKSGPWKETEWKICDYYLPHARGGGYILSFGLVDYVAYNYPLLKRYKSEDISLGAWLAALDITRIHDVRFNTEYKSRGCKNSYIVTHKQSEEDIRTLHSNLLNYGKMCTTETTVMDGYIYDWDAPPSQCCKRTKGIP